MSKISCTDYSSKICTELNWNEPNFIFYFNFIYPRCCLHVLILCLMYSCVLTAFNNKRISIISGTAGLIFTKLCLQILCGRGSVPFWWRCTTSCTSGFTDDVTFGRNGRDAETCRAAVPPWSDYHKWCCDTGTESDVYECLVLFCNNRLHDKLNDLLLALS